MQNDINHDGHSDIIGIRAPTQSTLEITVLLGNGTGGWGAPINTTITGVDSPGSYVRLGEFTSSGNLDVAVFGKDHVTGQNAVAVMLGNGNGTFQPGAETVTATLGNVQSGLCAANTGDYNGDGKLDLAYISSMSTGPTPPRSR